MNAPHLSVVRAGHNAGTSNPNSPAARAALLYAEAQKAALEQVDALEAGIAAVVGLAAEIAEGGEVYPVGVRELSRRMAEDLSLRAQTLAAIAQRAQEGRPA
jgi:hypothetical protein